MCVLKKHVESAVSQWLSFSNLAWSHPAIILWLLVSMRPHQPSCLSPSYTQSHTRTQMLVLLVIFFILLFFVLTLMMIWIDFYWLDLYPVCNVSCKKTLISCMSKLSSSYLRAICFDIGGLSWSEWKISVGLFFLTFTALEIKSKDFFFSFSANKHKVVHCLAVPIGTHFSW